MSSNLHISKEWRVLKEFYVHLFVLIINEARGGIRRRKTVNAGYEAEAQ